MSFVTLIENEMNASRSLYRENTVPRLILVPSSLPPFIVDPIEAPRTLSKFPSHPPLNCYTVHTSYRLHPFRQSEFH